MGDDPKITVTEASLMISGAGKVNVNGIWRPGEKYNEIPTWSRTTDEGQLFIYWVRSYEDDDDASISGKPMWIMGDPKADRNVGFYRCEGPTPVDGAWEKTSYSPDGEVPGAA